MEQDFVLYESAVKLREIGFIEPCLRVGNPHGHTVWKWYEVDADTVTVSVQDVLDVEYGPEWVGIPTYSQAFRWFRNKGLLIDVSSNDLNVYEFYIKISRIRSVLSDSYATHEDAERACLEKLIEIVKMQMEK